MKPSKGIEALELDNSVVAIALEQKLEQFCSTHEREVASS